MLKFRFQIGFYLIFGMANLVVLRFLKLPFDVKGKLFSFEVHQFLIFIGKRNIFLKFQP